MKKVIEICIRGDVFFFCDNLSEQQYNQVLLFAKKRFGKRCTDACQINDFVAEINKNYSVVLEQVVISRVIAF